MKTPLCGSEGQGKIKFNSTGIMVSGEIEFSYGTAFATYKRYLVESPLDSSSHKIETTIDWSTSDVVDPIETASDLLVLNRIKETVFEHIIKAAQHSITHAKSDQSAADIDTKFRRLVGPLGVHVPSVEIDNQMIEFTFHWLEV